MTDLLLAEAALHLEMHIRVPFPLSTLPCWSACELPPATVPGAGHNLLPLTSPPPGSLRSSCKHAVAPQVCMRVDLT